MPTLRALLGTAVLASCAGPSTYSYHEVVHRIEDLQQGDVVRVVRKEGGTFAGTVTAVEKPYVSFATLDQGTPRVSWIDIRVVERVRSVEVR